MYKSVSAFAPIANPINCPWGQKAFEGYFGKEDKEKWAEHDATELVKKWEGEPLDVLIDVVCFLLSLSLSLSLHGCFSSSRDGVIANAKAMIGHSR